MTRQPTPPVSAGADPSGRPTPYAGPVVFVGASTGGTEAIKTVLTGIPAGFAPILIVQHMPEAFTASFARRLDGLCPPHIVEAADGMPVRSGVVYIAPGHSHMKIRRAGPGFAVELLKTPPVNRHRPAVDVLFHSAAEQLGRRAVGVLLTGMGKDGAQGLKAMREAGAWTLAQDKASCVVYGMPREAIEIGAAAEALPLAQIAPRLLGQLKAGCA